MVFCLMQIYNINQYNVLYIHDITFESIISSCLVAKVWHSSFLFYLTLLYSVEYLNPFSTIILDSGKPVQMRLCPNICHLSLSI